jgi:hypothetical protein
MDLPEALRWYVHLASQPGWSAYVWHRVNEMARDFPLVFGELPALLTAEMKARRGGNEASREG